MIIGLTDKEALELRELLGSLERAKKIHHNNLIVKLAGQQAVWPGERVGDTNKGLLPWPKKD